MGLQSTFSQIADHKWLGLACIWLITIKASTTITVASACLPLRSWTSEDLIKSKIPQDLGAAILDLERFKMAAVKGASRRMTWDSLLCGVWNPGSLDRPHV